MGITEPEVLAIIAACSAVLVALVNAVPKWLESRDNQVRQKLELENARLTGRLEEHEKAEKHEKAG